MKRTGNLGRGIILAAFASGPAALLGAALVHYISIIPAAVPVSADDAGTVLVAIGAVTGLGALIGLLPIALSAMVLAYVGDRIILARSTIVWASIALALALAGDRMLGGLDPPFVAGLIAACLAASLVCRASIGWRADEEPLQAEPHRGPWGDRRAAPLA